jgi:hypothetical protein
MSVYPPAGFDLQGSVFCSACGENYGSFRAAERIDGVTGDGSEPSTDLRTVKRARSLIEGKVVFNARRSTLDCVLRDLSATGAKLIFSAHVPVPDEFDLELPQKGRTHRARIMWRKLDTCGVRFIED